MLNQLIRKNSSDLYHLQLSSCKYIVLPWWILPRLCSKSFKLGFTSTWTEKLQMYTLGLKKAEDPEVKLPTCIGSWKKQGSSRKTSVSSSLTMIKHLTVWIITNREIFLKRWKYQTILPASWETCRQDKKQQLDIEQWTGSKLEKGIYCHPDYLAFMQSTSYKMLGWMNPKLKSRFLGELSITSYMQMTPP